MDLTLASKTQLYAMIRNDQLDATLRKAANDEFNKRMISKDEIEKIVKEYDDAFAPPQLSGISLNHKLFLLILPLLFTTNLFVFSYSRMHDKKMRKEAMAYSILGYIIWTAGIFIYIYLNKRHS